jgi:UPF0271 protein
LKKVDINVDIGEGFPFDEDLLDFATSANVCCGAHAGSWELTKATIFLCRQKGVRIGMHPGFPDREAMGRTYMKEDEVAQFTCSLFEQAAEFWGYAEEAAYVKPHGAWYNMLTEPIPGNVGLRMAAELALQGVLALTGLPAMLLEGSPVVASITKLGEKTILEGFADRAYEPTGALRSRSLAGAVLVDDGEIRRQVEHLARKVDSICIHGDTRDCLRIAELVYKSLEDGGYEVGF